jgi:hypothetical protein
MSILEDAFVIYDETFIPLEKADDYFKALNVLVDWKYNSYGNYPLNRQTCVFADKEILSNKKTIPPIWGKDVSIQEWPPELLELKSLVEEKVFEITGIKWTYNVALGNKYTKSKDYISFHSDNEEYGSTQSIASISLGIPRYLLRTQTRRFGRAV